jgi:hypothetical protein
MAVDPWPDPAAPWESNGSDERWRRPVADAGWTRRDVDGYVDWVKVLPCPRCGQTMSVTVGPGAYRAATDDAHAGEVVASCNCTGKHDGRPEKRPRGCGYRGWIPLPPEAAE